MKHKLRDAIAIAQMDEHHSAQIAAAMHPAHEQRALAGVGRAQLSAAMRAAEFA
jgi:hypothetical protein